LQDFGKKSINLSPLKICFIETSFRLLAEVGSDVSRDCFEILPGTLFAPLVLKVTRSRLLAGFVAADGQSAIARRKRKAATVLTRLHGV